MLIAAGFRCEVSRMDDSQSCRLHDTFYMLGRAWPDDMLTECLTSDSWHMEERDTEAGGRTLGLVALLKRSYPPLVLTSGTFDLLNIGHEHYLHVAASYGGALVVGVDSDEKVRQRKGLERPICCQHARMTSVSRHPSISLVILKNLNAVKWSLIRTLHPDILVVSRPNYSESELTDLRCYAGRIVVMERTGPLSTSYLIQSTGHPNNITIRGNPLISSFCVEGPRCGKCSDAQNHKT